MFGLHKGSPGNGPNEETIFDLEKDLKNHPEKVKEVLQLIEDRMKKIKAMLRTGEGSDTYQSLGEIFNGYVSLLKVISRIASPSK